MKPRLAPRLALAAALLFAAGALATAGWSYHELHEPYAGWPGDHVDVVLEPGLDAGSMMNRLAEAGVLRSPRWVRAWLSFRDVADRLHAGEYRFDRPLAPLAVIGRLERGDVLLHPLTIPEGLTLVEVARRVAEAGFSTPEELVKVFRDPSPIADLDPAAPDLEGYLFPETYNFPRGESPVGIAQGMVGRFREVANPEFLAAAAGAGLDLRKAVILASLIEKETSVPAERARISRVFHNRLARGMKMECDPTVLYALDRAGQPVERLIHAHLLFESPWNTYRVEGLPPGPIANPGRDSLLAAVYPAAGDELYFVAAAEGGHRFSRNLSEHQRAVAEWRRYSRSPR